MATWHRQTVSEMSMHVMEDVSGNVLSLLTTYIQMHDREWVWIYLNREMIKATTLSIILRIMQVTMGK